MSLVTSARLLMGMLVKGRIELGGPEENESPGTQETIEERGDLGLEPLEPQSGALFLFNQNHGPAGDVSPVEKPCLSSFSHLPACGWLPGGLETLRKPQKDSVLVPGTGRSVAILRGPEETGSHGRKQPAQEEKLANAFLSSGRVKRTLRGRCDSLRAT